jgi:hypothetical protein
VPNVTTVYDEGFALLKPKYSGVYTIAITVTDGCNWVRRVVTVNANVQCCPHRAVATEAKSIKWFSGNATTVSGGRMWGPACASGSALPFAAPLGVAAPGDCGLRCVSFGFSPTQTGTTTLSALNSVQSTCLPADYVQNPSTYKTVYSPVMMDWKTNTTLTLFENPSRVNGPAVVPGCTWPGASNFVPTANKDDGSCVCAFNKNLWSISNSSYFQLASTLPSLPQASVGWTPNTLTFYTGNVYPSPPNTLMCMRRTNTTTALPVISGTVRGESTLQNQASAASGDILVRPSTSWAATYTANQVRADGNVFNSNDTLYNYFANVTNMCTVSVPAGPQTTDVQAVVAKGATADYRQCLGWYTFNLASQVADVCPASSDSLTVSVTCPAPPVVEILLNVNLLWNGKRFVKNVAPLPSTFTDDSWVQIDARDTPNMAMVANVTYSLNITAQPPANVYLGAGPSAPFPGGFVDLGYPANAYALWSPTNPNISAFFLPTRGSLPASPATPGNQAVAPAQYEVTMFANDNCNPPEFDSVYVSATCLNMAALPTYTPADGAVGPASYTATLTANATYGGLIQNFLNWGFRIVSRPTLQYGDRFPSGFLTANGQNSAECIVNNNFVTQATDTTAVGAFPATPGGPLPTVATTFGLAGPYVVQASVIDGCAVASAPTFTLTVTCAPADVLSTPTLTPAGPYVAVWNGASFAVPSANVPTAAAQGGAGASSAVYAWFLTSTTATNYSVAPYPAATANLPASMVTCTQGNTWAVGGKNALLSANPAGGMAPVATTPQMPTALTSFPVPGTFASVVLTVSNCGQANTPVTVATQCNQPARFVCANNATTGQPISTSNTPVRGAPLSPCLPLARHAPRVAAPYQTSHTHTYAHTRRLALWAF